MASLEQQLVAAQARFVMLRGQPRGRGHQLQFHPDLGVETMSPDQLYSIGVTDVELFPAGLPAGKTARNVAAATGNMLPIPKRLQAERDAKYPPVLYFDSEPPLVNGQVRTMPDSVPGWPQWKEELARELAQQNDMDVSLYPYFGMRHLSNVRKESCTTEFHTGHAPIVVFAYGDIHVDAYSGHIPPPEAHYGVFINPLHDANMVVVLRALIKQQ